jgi:hypothetical protein
MIGNAGQLVAGKLWSGHHSWRRKYGCLRRRAFARDYEYKRHGTLSLLAGIDLLTGKVVCTENLIGVDDVMESPKLVE